MCPLYPFHVIILYLCLLLPLLFAIVEGADELAGLKVPKWNVSFLPSKVEKLQENNFSEVQFTCQNCPLTDHDPGSLQLLLKNDQPDVAAIEFQVCFQTRLKRLSAYKRDAINLLTRMNIKFKIEKGHMKKSNYIFSIFRNRIPKYFSICE